MMTREDQYSDPNPDIVDQTFSSTEPIPTRPAQKNDSSQDSLLFIVNKSVYNVQKYTLE